MSKTLAWCMKQLNNKAYGGLGQFELDEIVPTLEKEIQSLKEQAKEALDKVNKIGGSE